MILQEQYLLVIPVLNVFILSLKYILKIIHILKSDRLLYLYRLSCLHVPLCTLCVPGAFRNQKRTRIAWNWNNRSLGTALSVLSSNPGSQKISQCSLQWNHLSAWKIHLLWTYMWIMYFWHLIKIYMYVFHLRWVQWIL